MRKNSLIETFAGPLEKHGFTRYMISGSVASAVYGEPRSTLDIDLVLLLTDQDILKLDRTFPESEYYLPPIETRRIENQRDLRGHFHIIHHNSGLKADCYPSRNHPYLGWAMRNRRRIELDGIQVFVAPPEYVILWKLEFHREGGGEKHLRDIRGILSFLGSDIENELLNEAIKELELTKSWEELKEKE